MFTPTLSQCKSLVLFHAEKNGEKNKHVALISMSRQERINLQRKSAVHVCIDFLCTNDS